MAGVVSPPITTNGDSNNTEVSTRYYYGDAEEDDNDPLGILGAGKRGEGAHREGRPINSLERRDGFTSGRPVAARNMARPFEMDCGRGDPCEVIDAILRNAKDVRDRVSSRQVHILDAYKAERLQLDKELACLPPSYTQYLAVRERANSRRRQRKQPPKAEATASHPLNFHLFHDATRASTTPLAGHTPLAGDGLGLENGLGTGGAGPAGPAGPAGEGQESAWDGKRGFRCDQEGGDSPAAAVTWPEDGDGAVKGQDADATAGHGADRRCSTRARAGSATENFIARSSTASQQHQRAAGGDWRRRQRRSPTSGGDRGVGGEDIPALRRSKVRGRKMVFSLLDAARVEEEHLETIVSECQASTGDDGGRRGREAAFRKLDKARTRNARELAVLMVEYDARPSTSRREHTLEKLRKAMPWPETVSGTTGERRRSGGCGWLTPRWSGGLARPRTGPARIVSSGGSFRHDCNDPSRRRGGGMDSEFLSPDQMKQTQQRHQESEVTIAEATAADVRNTVEVDAVDGVAEMEASDGGGRGDNGAFVLGAKAREDDGSSKEKEDNRDGGGDDDDGSRCHHGECGDGRPNRNIGLGEGPPDHDDRVDGGNLVRAPGAAADGGEDGETVCDRADVGNCSQQSEKPMRNKDDGDGAAGDSGIVAEFAHGSRPLLEVVDPASAGVSAVHVRDRGLAEQGGDGGGRPRGGQGVKNPTSDRVGVATPQKCTQKPTLPDPDQVNGAVLTDPFNMDHIKDLPGLMGGNARGFGALVSETVTYTDPAFPNLEFHRRAAMDRAGYFMPGYKPRVNSPGPGAGAYWLERRQSYRVKMAAPSHHHQRQIDSSRNEGGGRISNQPRRRSPNASKKRRSPVRSRVPAAKAQL